MAYIEIMDAQGNMAVSVRKWPGGATVLLALALHGAAFGLWALIPAAQPPEPPYRGAIEVVFVAPPEQPVPDDAGRAANATAQKAPPPQTVAPNAPALTPVTTPTIEARRPDPAKSENPQEDVTIELRQALGGLACANLQAEEWQDADIAAECAQKKDRVLARIARAEVGDGDLGAMMGGKFAGKDLYQIQVALGLRSTSLGTAYFVPVAYGPGDKAVDHAGFEDDFGPSPIPDAVTLGAPQPN